MDTHDPIAVAEATEDREFGWRGRIGLITPSAGWTTEDEWSRIVPAGVKFVVTRMPLNSTTPEALLEMGRHAVGCAELLATAEVNIIAYGCTVETILQGLDYDRAVTRRLGDAAGVPAVTMANAVLTALETLQARKIAFLTPYVPEINRREIAFLRGIGFDVVYDHGMGIAKTTDIARVPPGHIYNCAREALSRTPQAEALFISCGNLRSLDHVHQLEEEFGVPVVTSNQALLWRSLRDLGIADRLPRFGRLFA